MPSRTILQIQEWKKRLIDLSHRNRLIYFNPSNKTILEVIQPPLQDMLTRLVDEDRFNVWMPEEKDQDENDTDGSSKELFPEEPIITDVQTKKLPKDNDVVFAIDDGTELKKRIKRLYRWSASDYHEKGIRTTFIAFGVLRWKERSGGDEVTSPLLLCPVEIKKGKQIDSYTIEISDEDVVVNPALQVKLDSDFKIQLPELNGDMEGINLKAYFKAVESLNASKKWKIEERAFLGRFSFHKIVMYNDLTKNAASMEKNSIIEGLANGCIDRSNMTSELPKRED